MSALEDLHAMTVPEYVRAAELLGWDATELIEGHVYDMPAEKNRHLLTVLQVQRLLTTAFPNHVVAASGSVQLGPDSLVEPDVLVADSRLLHDLDDFAQGSDVLLAVEVSVTTLTRDLGPKLRAYATASVPEVWVIDARPGAGTLRRHTEPADGRYLQVQQFDVGECAERLDVAAIRD